VTSADTASESVADYTTARAIVSPQFHPTLSNMFGDALNSAATAGTPIIAAGTRPRRDSDASHTIGRKSQSRKPKWMHWRTYHRLRSAER
jgi:hypothetical protein